MNSFKKLYVIKKLVQDLSYKHHQHTPDESPANASFKEELDDLREDNKNRNYKDPV